MQSSPLQTLVLGSLLIFFKCSNLISETVPFQMLICSSSPHSRVAERALHLWLGPARWVLQDLYPTRIYFTHISKPDRWVP